MSGPVPEQPSKPVDTLGALKRSGFKLHQLNTDQENFSYMTGRGKDRKPLSISRQQIRDLLFQQTEQEVIAKEFAKDVKKKLTSEGLREDAKNIKTTMQSIRTAIRETNQKLIEHVAGSPEKAQELKEKYKAETGKKIEQKIAASERGALSAQMRKRYKLLLDSLPPEQQNSATGTPKERLRQLLKENKLPAQQALQLRQELTQPIEGFPGNRYVELFNTRIQDEWEEPKPLEEHLTNAIQSLLLSPGTSSHPEPIKAANPLPLRPLEDHSVIATAAPSSRLIDE